MSRGTIRVEVPGMLTTVQDLGREGYGALGVSASGAADAVALRIGNRLVGNPEGAAGLEMTLLGGTFTFPEGAMVALAGSDFGAMLDGAAVEMWRSIKVDAEQTLKFGPSRGGARCYLCVAGGIAVKPFLGSASTHMLSGLGGYAGRALRKGDELEIGLREEEGKTGLGAQPACRERRVSAAGRERLALRKTLRVTEGPQWDWFSEMARRTFFEGTYRLAEESNRMGLRLEGAAIAAEATHGGMITEGVALGAIQVPESGQPIILFVEQQTTGGYPKIANVISADMGYVGQLRPRDEVRFKRVEWGEARRLLQDQEAWIAAEEWIER